MSTATEEMLASLHGLMADKMKEKLETNDFTASDLSVMRQFLKDNGINCDGKDNPKLKSLSDSLPDGIDNVMPLYGG